MRLKDYLINAHAEIVVERSKPSRNKVKTVSTPAARSPSRSASTSSSPMRRLGVVEETAVVSAADQPLLDWLQQQQQRAESELSPSFMAEVASTVFGDALGGSWRTYAPFPSVASSNPHAKADVQAAGYDTRKSSSEPGKSPIGSLQIPVRAFTGVTALTFSGGAHTASRSLLSSDPVNAHRQFRGLFEDEDEEEAELDLPEQRGESLNGEESAKRPRK
jgi:hypothetical protein